ncbi:pyridoxamine 5'-phosphate oxidase family protein [Rhodococcus triatomae]|nr:pyridoxamine 5'-phosphate oxidase family protein [Rhodococcus triatomae]QNG20099.1 pyridoxamine 5'-phosphate oxidase family protein [Rhodococcus triatomae]QNG23985.1 pyridoxamine 5'-phosphate oxidase family protein [Rhodococcus triatomae]
MTSWKQFDSEAPELAAAIRARFEAHRHHVLATLRRDGSPRVSGTEVQFGDVDLMLGSMLGARKARDLQRDPRYAVHAHTGDGTMEGGDAKVSGRARELDGPEWEAVVADYPPEIRECHVFVLDLDEAVLTTIEDGDKIGVQLWRPGQGVTRTLRAG